MSSSNNIILNGDFPLVTCQGASSNPCTMPYNQTTRNTFIQGFYVLGNEFVMGTQGKKKFLELKNSNGPYSILATRNTDPTGHYRLTFKVRKVGNCQGQVFVATKANPKATFNIQENGWVDQTMFLKSVSDVTDIEIGAQGTCPVRITDIEMIKVSAPLVKISHLANTTACQDQTITVRPIPSSCDLSLLDVQASGYDLKLLPGSGPAEYKYQFYSNQNSVVLHGIYYGNNTKCEFYRTVQ